MSLIYSNEDSRSAIDMDASFDDGIEDDFDEAADQPLNRPKVDFTPVRDPLVAALFGPAAAAHGERAAEQECDIAV